MREAAEAMSQALTDLESRDATPRHERIVEYSLSAVPSDAQKLSPNVHAKRTPVSPTSQKLRQLSRQPLRSRENSAM